MKLRVNLLSISNADGFGDMVSQNVVPVGYTLPGCRSRDDPQTQRKKSRQDHSSSSSNLAGQRSLTGGGHPGSKKIKGAGYAGLPVVSYAMARTGKP